MTFHQTFKTQTPERRAQAELTHPLALASSLSFSQNIVHIVSRLCVVQRTAMFRVRPTQHSIRNIACITMSCRALPQIPRLVYFSGVVKSRRSVICLSVLDIGDIGLKVDVESEAMARIRPPN